MMSIVLTILKIIGIILLIILCFFIFLLSLALFVPIRYKITIHRKTGEENPIIAGVKLSWLLHILTLSYFYPDEAYVKGRLFGFTIYRSDREDKKNKNSDNKQTGSSPKANNEHAENTTELAKNCRDSENNKNTESSLNTESSTNTDSNEVNDKKANKEEKSNQKNSSNKKISKIKKIIDYLKKVWKAIRNIKYTIKKICDKIKHIVKNIKYYIRILQSDLFSRSWKLCKKQAMGILNHIKPRKVKGIITVGTGDPAGTGQVCAIFGILYPILGAGITLNPDFEQAIFEGDLLIKGRITAFKMIKTGGIIYFNKDLRHLIQLFNREAVNGR